ncbi:restriction endonuclease subunit S [Mycoplasma sp. Ms02]|uniref:restriction endonuclease subunit S n=1 Tax=Mycoplasma sp. Ms02 TaxID=353851 RepID=UPI001C89FA8E|nr:restriction endonuclease subunit S [Mycoplasma sp. Ms02]QZE12450.1 restriction endonuclease subunit S [Mycoplasma sp. Ms02]
MSDIVFYQNGKSFESFQSDQGKYSLVKMNSVNFDGVFKESGKFIDLEAQTLLKDDIIMIVSDIGFGNLIGLCGVIPENNKYVLNTHTALLRLNQLENNSIYVQNFINKNQPYFKKNCLGMSQLHITKSSILDFPIYTPFIAEQVKIGKNLRFVLDIFESSIKIIEFKIVLKQTLLSKLLIKNNSSLPDFRFKGFEDEWTYKSWSEIVEKISKNSNDNTLPKLEYEDIDKGNGVLNKDISNKFDNRKGILFEPGDVLFGKLRPYLKNWWLAEFIGIALGNFWVMKPLNNDSNFVFNLLQTNRFKEVSNLTFGTKMPSSDWSLVSEQTFAIPSLSEQVKIGRLFKLLDKLINLQKQEINILQNLKKTAMKMLLV